MGIVVVASGNVVCARQHHSVQVHQHPALGWDWDIDRREERPLIYGSRPEDLASVIGDVITRADARIVVVGIGVVRQHDETVPRRRARSPGRPAGGVGIRDVAPRWSRCDHWIRVVDRIPESTPLPEIEHLVIRADLDDDDDLRLRAVDPVVHGAVDERQHGQLGPVLRYRVVGLPLCEDVRRIIPATRYHFAVDVAVPSVEVVVWVLPFTHPDVDVVFSRDPNVRQDAFFQTAERVEASLVLGLAVYLARPVASRRRWSVGDEGTHRLQ